MAVHDHRVDLGVGEDRVGLRERIGVQEANLLGPQRGGDDAVEERVVVEQENGSEHGLPTNELRASEGLG